MSTINDDEFDFGWPADQGPASEIDTSLPTGWPPRPLIASEPLPELFRDDSPTPDLVPVGQALEHQVERIELLLRQLSDQTKALAVRVDELGERLRVEVVRGSAQAEIRLARDMDKLVAIIELAIEQQRQPRSEGATRDDLQLWVETVARMASVQDATTAKLEDLLTMVLQRGRTLTAVPDRARGAGPS